MSFMLINPARTRVPMAQAHRNYPGSWTWQSVWDTNPTNPKGNWWPGFNSGPRDVRQAPRGRRRGVSGLGASDELAEGFEARVVALEAAAGAAIGPVLEFWKAQASALRAELVVQSEWGRSPRVGLPPWSPSKADLLARVNEAHTVLLKREGKITGQEPQSPALTFVQAVPGAIVQTAQEQAAAVRRAAEQVAQAGEQRTLTYGLGLAGLALVGVYLYAYAGAKGAARARRR